MSAKTEKVIIKKRKTKEKTSASVKAPSEKKKSYKKIADDRLVKEAAALVSIFLGLFITFCIINPPMSGSIGSIIGVYLDCTLGWAAYLIPYLFLITGICIFFPVPYLHTVYYSAAVAAIVFSAETLRGILSPASASTTGRAIGEFLVNSIGKTASFTFIFFMVVIAVMIFSGVSLLDAAKKIWETLSFGSPAEDEDEEDEAEISSQESLESEKSNSNREKEAEKSADEGYDKPRFRYKKRSIEKSDSFQGEDILPADVASEENLFLEKTGEIEAVQEPDCNISEQEELSDYYKKHQDEILNDFLGSDSSESDSPQEEDPPENSFVSLDKKEQTRRASNLEPSPDLLMVSDDITYTLPPLNFLSAPEPRKSKQPFKDYSQVLIDTLESFGVSAKIEHIERGPSVTRYELQPGKGVKVSKFTNLTNDISLVFASPIRIEAPVPGKSCIGIEVPNDTIEPVFLREIFASDEFNKKSYAIPIALGKDITGRAIVGDMVKMPHLLVAGSTGSGKSVCMNCLIASILYKARPTEVQMVMIDPKRVELSMYEGIPHLVDIKATPDKKIITDPKIATLVLQQMTEIMDNRYDEFSRMKARNIGEYNQKTQVHLPYLLIFIDELADLMMVSGGGVDKHIARLAQMGRAAGMHLIVATQRPSVDVLTGIIKVNIPSRIAFAVASQIDSRTILDRAGAEKLLGKGDMLYQPGDAPDARRVQGAYVSSEDIERVVAFWQEQPPPENMQSIEIKPPEPEEESKGDEGGDEDELYPEALRIILTERNASVSILQRKLKIGYARAGRIIDQMERKGAVGPANGSKSRKILVGAMAGDHFLNSEN